MQIRQNEFSSMISMPDPQLSIDTVLITVNQLSRMWRELIKISRLQAAIWGHFGLFIIQFKLI